jgi:iron complex outermembrane recepter protein
MKLQVFVGLCVAATATCPAAADRQPLEEVVVVAPYGIVLDPALVPANVQRAVAEQLQRSQSLDLADFLNRQFSSVNINHSQNNPLQPDFAFRGFTASPLLGLPQGLSVYLNGVRINDPFGDTINWDLIALSAIDSVQMLAGAQPVFGLNTLGGALSLRMKNGFGYRGTQVEAYGDPSAVSAHRFRPAATMDTGDTTQTPTTSAKMAGAIIRTREPCASTEP